MDELVSTLETWADEREGENPHSLLQAGEHELIVTSIYASDGVHLGYGWRVSEDQCEAEVVGPGYMSELAYIQHLKARTPAALAKKMMEWVVRGDCVETSDPVAAVAVVKKFWAAHGVQV